MTKVEKMRQKHKADFQARYGISLTYLPFITRAAVEGLRTYPLLNASIESANIVYHNEINIGIAVALENGLIVPVIRGADEKNVLGLQRAIVDLGTFGPWSPTPGTRSYARVDAAKTTLDYAASPRFHP